MEAKWCESYRCYEGEITLEMIVDACEHNVNYISSFFSPNDKL